MLPPIDGHATSARGAGTEPQPSRSSTVAGQGAGLPFDPADERATRRELFGWWFGAFVLASALAWLAMAAVFLMARDRWGMEVLPALGFALIGAVPGLGNGAGAYAAIIVWGWHPALAVLVFLCAPLLVAYPAWLDDARSRRAERAPSPRHAAGPISPSSGR